MSSSPLKWEFDINNNKNTNEQSKIPHINNQNNSATPKTVVAQKAEEIRKNLKSIALELANGMVDREVESHLVVLTALCGEHILLLGEPGVGKSYLCNRLAKWMDTTVNTKVFDRLLTRFTLPDEIFGPVSLQALKNDEYIRKVDGYLPDAPIAFLDEIFKANSAILNSLLTILNEKKFDNGKTRSDVPLRTVVTASNEYPPPTGELQALYDRILFRVWVNGVKYGQPFMDLLELTNEAEHEVAIPKEWRLTLDVGSYIQEEAENVKLPIDVKQALNLFGTEYSSLKDEVNFTPSNLEDNYTISPRRWMKVVKVLKTSAWTHGRKDVHLFDCLLLQHLVWQHHSQQERVVEKILYAISVIGTQASKMKLLDSLGRMTDQDKNILLSHPWLSGEDKTKLVKFLTQKSGLKNCTEKEVEENQSKENALAMNLLDMKLSKS